MYKLGESKTKILGKFLRPFQIKACGYYWFSMDGLMWEEIVRVTKRGGRLFMGYKASHPKMGRDAYPIESLPKTVQLRRVLTHAN
jgi:hypothetical protein